MTSVRPRMTHLFEQLGLDASEAAIAHFILMERKTPTEVRWGI